jgi:hypothetical protein
LVLLKHEGGKGKDGRRGKKMEDTDDDSTLWRKRIHVSDVQKKWILSSDHWELFFTN